MSCFHFAAFDRPDIRPDILPALFNAVAFFNDYTLYQRPDLLDGDIFVTRKSYRPDRSATIDETKSSFHVIALKTHR